MTFFKIPRLEVQPCVQSRTMGRSNERPFGFASAQTLGIIRMVASQHIENVLYLRDRMRDRCATPRCVFSEAE